MVTIEEIRKIAQPPEKMQEEFQNFPYIGRILRRISPHFTKFFVEHNITPNQVTDLSILLVIVGGFLFVFGDYYLMLIGCVFYLFWLLFDYVDGEIARVTNLETIGGHYLEGVHHSFECCFFAFFGIGLFKMLGNIAFAFFGFTVSLFIGMGKCFVFSRTLALLRMPPSNETKHRKEKQYTKYVNPLRKKQFVIKTVYRLYVRIRRFFLFNYIHLIIICILIFELLLPIKIICVIYGIPLTILSAYFFFCGFGWIFRESIGGITNYIYLTKD